MNFEQNPELLEVCYENKRSDFININEIPEEHCDTEYHICFTFVIPSNNWIEYYTKKGTLTKRRYSKCPYNIQKTVLTSNMPPEWLYYYEHHKDVDTRYHIHGYAYTTVNEMNAYRKYQFGKIDCHKSDIQDKLFLAEITKSRPSWTKYCTKEQDLTKQDIDILENKKPIVQIEERDYTTYLHGKNLTVFL